MLETNYIDDTNWDVSVIQLIKTQTSTWQWFCRQDLKIVTTQYVTNITYNLIHWMSVNGNTNHVAIIPVYTWTYPQFIQKLYLYLNWGHLIYSGWNSENESDF